jgi:hypothetical protein
MNCAEQETIFDAQARPSRSFMSGQAEPSISFAPHRKR